MWRSDGPKIGTDVPHTFKGSVGRESKYHKALIITQHTTSYTVLCYINIKIAEVKPEIEHWAVSHEQQKRMRMVYLELFDFSATTDNGVVKWR